MSTDGLPSEGLTLPKTAGLLLQSFRAIEDVPVPISVELDRRTISTDELIRLEPGAILPLSRAAGENIDVFVAGVHLGNAEIVVMENKLAIRMADLRAAAV